MREGSRDELLTLFDAIGRASAWPAGDAASAQNEWIDFGEVEACVAGWMHVAVDSGHTDPAEVRRALLVLDSHPRWAERWPEEHAALVRACEVLRQD